MATLDSTTTRAQALAEYQNTAGYEEQNSTALALRFITACKHLRVMTPRVAADPEGNTIQLSPEQLQSDENQARQFLAARGGTAKGGAPGVKYYSMAGFRK